MVAIAGGAAVRARARPEAGRQPGGKPNGAADTLLEAALDLFARQDYSTVTIKDIARQTGFNPSLLYYYFDNKEELFLRAIELTVATAFEKFEALDDHPDSPEAIIASWIEVHITQFVLMQKLAKVSLDYANTRNRTAKLDEAIRQFYDKESVVLGRAIKDGIDRGLFRPVRPKQMAVFISTFLDGSLFRSMMFPEFDYAAAIRHMRTVVLDQLRVVQPAAKPKRRRQS